MTVDFTIENRGDYLHLTVTGEIRTVADVLEYGTVYRDEAESLGIKKALIDYRAIDVHLDFYEMVQLAKYMESSKFTYRGLKVVHLVAPKDLKRFEEYKVPALNRGFRFESFTDEKEALAWLFAD